MHRWLTLLTAVVVAAACRDATSSGDPCDQTDNKGQLENVALTVSPDSAPLISWGPGGCGISYVELWRFNNGQCAPGASGAACGSHYLSVWRVGTGGLPLTPYPGPPTISSPVRYGVTPGSAFLELGPDSIRIGDTLLLYVARPREPNQSAAPFQSLSFVVGVGAQ